MTYLDAVYKQSSMDANFDIGFLEEETSRFGSSTTEQQVDILSEKDRESTQRATK